MRSPGLQHAAGAPPATPGFSILFVDAMHYNNYAARLSHSCDPNVEVSCAIDGERINFYAKKDVQPGELYNYHSCTDSMKEVEAAFCLCGAKRCRASYLAFVGKQGNNHVRVDATDSSSDSRAPARRRDGHALRQPVRDGEVRRRPRFAPRRAAVARALRRPRRALHAPRTRAVTATSSRNTARRRRRR